MLISTRAALLAAASAALLAQPPLPLNVPLPSSQTAAILSSGAVSGLAVKNAPYSAEAVTEMIQTLVDGNRIVRRSSTLIYRDSQGRERREASSSGNGSSASRTAVFISDPVAGFSYSIDPLGKVALKSPLAAPPSLAAGLAAATAGGPPRVSMNVRQTTGPGGVVTTTSTQLIPLPSPAPNPNAGQRNNTKFETLGSKVIEGVSADGVRYTTTIPAGQIGNDRDIEVVSETWHSNDLNLIVASEHRDPRAGVNIFTLKNISRAEPSPTLFQVPVDYTLNEPRTVQRIEQRPPQQ